MSATSSLLIALLLYLTSVRSDDRPSVTIHQGTLLGQKVDSQYGTYYSFLGIPYAKPPLGDLRFKAPIAPEPWNGTFDASQVGNVCIQPDSLETESGEVIGDEDCLNLSVFTPQLPDPNDLLPVMVWIHGGGFTIGSGYGQGPEFLLSRGIVYVAMEYRLGVLGFLATEDSAAPGNAGLKDQVQALRWVKENIAAFGGDPTKVTIFGESAGGASVSYHMISSMSEGLFRGAIAESGTAVYRGSQADRPRETAFLLGSALGYSGNNSHELVQFLRTVNAEDLVQAGRTTIPEWNDHKILKEVIYSPCAEPAVEEEAAFLPDSPIQLVNQGQFKNIPFITGVTSAEGIYFVYAAGLLDGGRTFEDMDENFAETFKTELRTCGQEACDDAMVMELKSYYFGDQPLGNASITNLTQLITDIRTDSAVYEVQEVVARNTAPVYLYEFSYDGGLAAMKQFNPLLQQLPGVCHADELGYIFNIGIEVSEDSKDAQVRSEVVEMWTNFAKTGNPTPDAKDKIPQWLPHSNTSSYYLDIGSQLVVKTGLRKKYVDFQESLYQKYTTHV